jgi:acyl transferase domain-containing protein/NAD(P)H-dependent flavin oxidoreductase YrpB (nitropropane dioxygenase family)/NAD(P)-dependent dehydrogenase (short-subunit alcohol dehydrogenase family)
VDAGFRCLTLTPAGFGDPAVAIASARAGAVGLLDMEFSCDVARAEDAFRRLIASCREGCIGLRLGAGPVEFIRLLEEIANRPHWLLLPAQTRDGFTKLCSRLPRSAVRVLLAEITDAAQAVRLADIPVSGLVARGHEAGGWVGEDSSFILLQKLLARQERPVYVLGGIGLYAAAACRAVGAAGVVLDDQLLLMAESPLPRQWRRRLEAVSGQDARTIGERCGVACRVLVRPDFSGSETLQKLAHDVEVEGIDPEDWRQRAKPLVGWGPPNEMAWPVGQAIGLAMTYRNRFKNTGRLIEGLTESGIKIVDAVRRDPPLRANSPLARSHQTRFPIVQGPMTRVSDSAAFANVVSRCGALPFLALALMTGEQTLHLLRETAALVGDRPWGVGLLGFAPRELREEQIRSIFEVRPAFAVIAGGRPDQAAEFERRAISAYVHVPTPELLRLFLVQGARRFLFEGRECGGHIGPLASFALWELQIELLLESVSRADAEQVHVLFAGGIHDARSAAMVSTMAAPLVERGMRVGVLLGSAYLFTEEIVETGAIVPEFQAQALACERTITLETGPGHSTRCAATPFGEEFFAERRRLIASGRSLDEIREHLENLNLGRLRIASKGRRREGKHGIVDLPVETQMRQGMYMIGQVATLHDRITTLAALHQDVADGSAALLQGLMEQPQASPSAQPSDIAIIGIATLLPKASSPEEYWSNLLQKTNAISEIPKERWDWRLYFDENRQARDKIYSRWGGFLDEIRFDPLRYGIPPRSLKSIDPLQLLTLEVVRRALEDAGYAEGGFDRENTSVILGAGGGLGDLGMQYGARSEIPRLVGSSEDDEVWERLPEWTEESFAGSLINVAAGRAANRFDLGGLNFTVDAACASGLAAISLAVSELETGRTNVAIAGGIDTIQSPFAFLCFSKTQALSPKGYARAFDKNSDGIVISEGLAVLVMKRLADAERAGDRVYAVIKAVAGSSDGKSLGLTAPLPEGQMRALRRAYAKAGVSPGTLGLIEAHGTGTSVGDRAEAETIIRTLKSAGATARYCAMGSVKTLIGHTKATAGAAGLIKIALALHHRVLPPHAGVDDPLDMIAATDSPVYMVKDAKPWFGGQTRRAAASAFGFGGTNFHAILEEYSGEYRADAAPLGGALWPCELFVFRGADSDDLSRQIAILNTALDADAEVRLRDIAYSLALAGAARRAAPAVATIVAADLAQLRDGLQRLAAALRGEGATPLPLHIGLSLRSVWRNARIALLFPGQGSQYLGMAREAALYLGPVRAALERADQAIASLPRRLTEYIYPAAFTDAEEREARVRLTDTDVAQPAIGAVSSGFLDLLSGLGLEADMAAGHSYGEFAALHAAGALTRDEFLVLSSARGRVMADACNAPERGAMAAVSASREDVEAAVVEIHGVVVANHNAPRQVVISGAEAAVLKAVEALKANGLDSRILPVAGAFHSPLMAPSKPALDAAIGAATIAAPRFAVYSNVTALPYLPHQVREQLGKHLLSTVEFVDQIRHMYDDGARVFIEVGPRTALSGLVGQILAGCDHLAVAVDNGGMRGVLSAIGALFGGGVELDIVRLFDDREVQEIDLARIARAPQPAASQSTWFVNGGSARPSTEAVRKTGRQPALTVESVAEMRCAAAPWMPPIAAPAQIGDPLARASVAGGQPSGIPIDALLAYQETMQQFLQLQNQVMARFLGGVEPEQSIAPGMPSTIPPFPDETIAPSAAMPMPPAPITTDAAPTPPGTVSNVPQSASALGREALGTLLLDLVSERTGYPPDMLGLDRDMEAELGIDSIKRIEILGALEQRLPAVLAEHIKSEMETLTRVKSLAVILDHLTRWGAPAAMAAPPPDGHRVDPEPRQTPPDTVKPVPRVVPRFVMEETVRSLARNKRTRLQGVFLVTEDELGVTAEVGRLVESRGALTVVLSRAVLADEDALARQVIEARSSKGPFTGVIHLASLSRQPTPQLLTEWRAQCCTSIKSFYHVLRLCADDLDAAAGRGEARIFAASGLGGRYGRGARVAESASAGGVHGLVKTAHAEWPDAIARGLDFDQAASVTEIATRIVDELEHEANELEVGYADDLRLVFTPVAAHYHRPAFGVEPDGEWVMLVTGGARGITAELMHEIARPGMKLFLVGRTVLPTDEAPDTAGIEDAAALRRALMARAGLAASPVGINRDIERLRAEREIRRNIWRLQEVGAIVNYHALDVRDEASVRALLGEIYAAYGKIDGVIHGAGVIEDKLIRDKTPDSYARVFETKADSAFILLRHLKGEPLKLAVLLTSVAGRFGNRGQADYAAANETVNRLAWEMRRAWPKTRVIALNWGPWDAPGMASEAVRRKLQERGVDLVTVSAGREFFARELREGTQDDVEIVAGAGPWEQAEFSAHKPFAEHLKGFAPFLAATPKLQADRSVTLEHDFDLDWHHYLEDHQIDSVAVLPAAAAVEWMAQFVQASWPDWKVHRIGDLRVLRGFRLDKGGRKRALFRARASSHADTDSLKVSVDLVDPETNAPYYKGVAELASELPQPKMAEIVRLRGGESLSPEEAYRDHLFHGRCFQLVKAIYAVNNLGVDAEVLPSHPADWLDGSGQSSDDPTGQAPFRWLFDPGLIDTAPQLAIIWARLLRGITPLPSRFGAVTRSGALRPEEKLQLRIRMKPSQADTMLRYDAFFVDASGHIRLTMHDIESTGARALNRLAKVS